ncbi:MAG: DUF5667 domain-containing protein [Marmoricola sp.]
MNALIPAHRRAKKFAALVDASSTTDAGPRDVRFLEIVGALRSAAAESPAPRADYVQGLRDRLMAEADTALVPTDRKLVLRQHVPRRQNRLTAAAATLVIVGGTAGMSFAAQGSLPGDALYPLKRGIEHVNETFSFSDAARGEDLLHQADTRLSEVDSMLAVGASDNAIADNLHTFTTSAGKGADLLFTTFQNNGNDDSVSTVRDFAGTDMRELADLAQRAPRSLRPEFALAAQLLADLDQQARVLCAQCGARGPLTLPGDLKLVSSDGLARLLDVAGTAGSPTKTSAGASSTPTAASAEPTSNATAAPNVKLPDLGALLGNNPAGAGDPKGGTGSAGVSNPLGGLLNPVPTSVSSGGVDVGKLGKVVKGGVTGVTDPLLKPKPRPKP